MSGKRWEWYNDLDAIDTLFVVAISLRNIMADGLKKRVERLEAQVADLQTALAVSKNGDWRRAVEKYAGDADLLAVFAEAKKLREAERKAARGKSRRSAS
jgi:hypothetical protein